MRAVMFWASRGSPPTTTRRTVWGAGFEGLEFGAGHSCDVSSIGGVDDRLGDDRLATGAVGHDETADASRLVDEDLGGLAAIEILNASLQERVVEGAFHVHRSCAVGGAVTSIGRDLEGAPTISISPRRMRDSDSGL